MAADDVVGDPLNGIVTPVVRFYCWAPSAVSLGRFQSNDAVVAELCSAEDWEIVRRPTGGRALLHHHDLSYSVILPGGSASPDQLRLIYDGVAFAQLEAFRNLGVKADYIPRGREFHTRDNSARAKLCLESRVRGELIVGERKIAAAAQRIYSKSILQHGSIPLTGDVGAIARVIPATPEMREESAATLRRSAIALDEAAGRQITPEELIQAMIPSLAARFGFKFIQSELEETELQEIKRRRPEFEVFSLSKRQV